MYVDFLVRTFFPVVFPAKQAAIHVEGKNEGFQGTYLIGETGRSSPESFILREKPLLPVSGSVVQWNRKVG
jgi:hypothetical protein